LRTERGVADLIARDECQRAVVGLAWTLRYSRKLKAGEQ
jgi:hypothetical protein